MAATQANRDVSITTPLGDDVLLFRRMSIKEELGRLFQCNLELWSLDEQLALDDVLGLDMTVTLALPNNKKRYFHGFVSRFSQTGREGDYAVYQAELSPWLWFLTRTSDCRIFQDKSVPDIVAEVFREHGFTDFELQLNESYRQWGYCVQYRESDFNFVSRLLEQEGIYYYFRHEQGKHHLILADSYSAHESQSGYETVNYYPPSENEVRKETHISDWFLSREVQPGGYVLNDFDFERPKANLLSKSISSRQHAAGDYEIFDYPGEYLSNGDGDVYARTRLEGLQAQHERVQGQANSRGLSCGALFKLALYPRKDQNREYLISGTTCEFSSDAYASGGAGGFHYHCAFTALDAQQPFRSQRMTPKPLVQGPQTAIVVGKSGEEVWTDKYGRVKVQFHWDRYGQADENSSCWVRVAQIWAGGKWGGIHTPRIGQEVIVEFLEGDPDRPIITGRVYNGDRMPPYDLPANATQSGIKSRSSKGGGADNFNEIRFEDKKGEEELYLHAEKNHTNITENDRSESVGHDRSLSVGNDKSESIGNNKSIDVAVDHSESIGANKTLSVGSNHSEQVGSNMSITVGSNLTESVAINYAETVGAAMELTIGAAFTETVGAAKEQTIANNKSETIGKNKSVSVGKDLSEEIGGAHSENVTKEYSLNAKKVVINAEKEITIKTGKASISMKDDGTITISGKNINIKGSGAINVKASKNIVMKGKKILGN